MDVLLANPRGFCAGVDRAIAIVEQALALYGAPIYVRHEVVHNRFVVEDLKAKGAVFVEDLDEVPAGSTVVFSAHGVAEERARRSGGARPQGLRRDVPAGDQGPCRSREDARARPRNRDDRPCRAPGGRGHDGPMRRRHPPRRIGGRCRPALGCLRRRARLRDADDPLGGRRGRHRRGAERAIPADRRPEEGRHLLRDAEPAGRRQVHGAARSMSSSSSAARTAPTRTGCAKSRRTAAFPPTWSIGRTSCGPSGSPGKASVGVTAGASAPEVLVQEVLARLAELGARGVRELDGVAERVVFPLPKGLQGQAATSE